MPPVLVLLSLLVGTLEVSAAPLEKGIHPDEMVTRCIVEVLSNALAKPNAPPIDPECKEILKKSSQHSLNEKEDEQKQYETRNNKDFGGVDKHQYESKEEEKQDLPKEENEEKRHHEEEETKEEKGEEKKHVEDKEETTGHSKERGFIDDNEDDGDDEEGEEHKNQHEKEEVEKKANYHHDSSQEVKHDIFDKKVHQTAKSVEEFSEEDEEPNHLEEIFKRYPISQSPKEPIFHKYQSPHSDETSEESDEKEEEKKRSYNPKHDDFAQRILDYEEKRSRQEDERNYLPSNEDIFHYRGQKPRFGQDPFENHLKNNYEKRTHHEIESSEESREKRHHHQDSEEEEDHRDRNDESNERELMGHHYDDKKHYLEVKRWPSPKNTRPNYDQSSEDSEESKEDIEKRHKDDRLEKQDLYRKLKHHLQDSEEDRSYKPEKKQEDKRHYISDEMVDEMKRYYPDLSYEQNIRHYNGKNTDESHYPGNDKYKRRHSEEETRSFSRYSIPEDPFRWKNSRYFENKDNGEEERKRSQQSKNLFPDYDDYDLWGKKQFLDDINREYGEKKNPLKIPKFEEKRQYDRMDELAQLLNYKKKSVEFPDFYDSGEIKKRHFNERSRLRQRPLTEEEEKELENLAIMDLELQKIAEKLSNNRQG
ncbi:secretogranin-1 [Dendropsophus ebraccatus]|uniref:secretogranin-1 n=1 Tax=Dendropsophus ebraccatus TaxID=150705 RepID=UPI0038322E4D